MPPGLIQEPLVDSLQSFAVLLCQFAIGLGVHIVNKASPSSWEGWKVADIDKVGIVEEEEGG
jgi:hypothetical protein